MHSGPAPTPSQSRSVAGLRGIHKPQSEVFILPECGLQCLKSRLPIRPRKRLQSWAAIRESSRQRIHRHQWLQRVLPARSSSCTWCLKWGWWKAVGAHLVSSLDVLKDALLNDTLAFSIENFFAHFLLGGFL